MKQLRFLKAMFVMLLVMFASNAWGEEETVSFTNKDWAPWTNVTSGSSFESSSPARGVANNGVNGACKSTNSYFNVTKVTVVCSSNTTGGKVKISIGNQVIADKSVSKANNQTLTFDSSDYPDISNLSGLIHLNVTKPSSKTVWVKSVTITTSGNSTPTKYDVIINNGIQNGTVTASPTSAAEGAEITLTATPASGYEFGSWNVTNASTSAAITVTDNKFTMPAANVNVSATFNAIPQSNYETIAITASSIVDYSSIASGSYQERNWIEYGIGGVAKICYNSNTPELMQYKEDCYVYNTTSVPGNIKTITLTYASGNEQDWNVYVSPSPITSVPSTNGLGQKKVTKDGSQTWIVTDGDYPYFYIKNISGYQRLSKIEIVYEPTSTKTPTELAWKLNEEIVASHTVTIGSENNFPSIYTNPEGLAGITYRSSNENVVTIDNNGVISLVGAGTTNITAFYGGDDTYSASYATYILTVNASAEPQQYTITVTTPENGDITVKNGDNVIASGSTVAVGTTITLEASARDGYTFNGWNVSGATVANATSTTTTFEMPASNVTVAANFSQNQQGGDGKHYRLVTSTSDLVAGCNYVIASNKFDPNTDYRGNYPKGYFLSNQAKTNNRPRTSIEYTYKSTIVEIPKDAMILELGVSSNAWTFYTTNYSQDNNYLKTNFEDNGLLVGILSDDAIFNIDISSSAVITNGTLTMKYNKGDGVFSCYGSSSTGVSSVYLYKEILGPVDPTITTTDKEIVVEEELDVTTMFSSNSNGEMTYRITSTPDGATYTFNSTTFSSSVPGEYEVTVEQTDTELYNAGTATAKITVIQTYPVYIETPENGTITVKNGETTINNEGMVKPGTNLTIIPTAAENYRFKSWSYKEGDGEWVTVSSETFTHSMPEATLTIKAEFEDIPEYTIQFSINGSVNAEQSINVREDGVISFPEVSSLHGEEESLHGLKFMGWISSEIEGTTNEEPEFVNTDACKATSDQTYYAVFATFKQGSGTTTITDVITRETTGVSDGSTSYSNWEGKTVESSAVYKGNSAGSNNSIQLRTTNSNSGIITTTSGGLATKVTIEWNSNTANGRTLDVYGKNTQYKDPTNLYNNSYRGEKLGSIVKGTSTSLTIDGEHKYIGVRSNSGAMYITSISIDWSTGEPDTYTDYRTLVCHNRTVTAGNYGTVCLPFGVEKSEDTQIGIHNIYNVKSFSDEHLIVESIDENMIPGKGYIFKAKDGDNKIDLVYNNEYVKNPITNDDYLEGTFTPVKAVENSFVISNNKFWLVTTDIEVPSYRAWVKPLEGAPSKLSISVFDGESTGITNVNINQNDGNIYNLNGQRVITPIRGQIYIQNGMKFIAK